MKTLVQWISKIHACWRSKYIVSHISPWIPELVNAIPRLIEIAPADNWRIQRVTHTLTDMNVLIIGPVNSSYTVILHLPTSKSAISGFEYQKKICASLQADTHLGEWRHLLPNVLHEGMFQGQPYWIEERLPGISAADAMQNPDVRQAALGSALEAVEHLHRRTAIEVSVDDKLLDEWVFHPVQNIRSSTLVNYHRQGHALLNQLEMYLSEKLRDQRLVMGWIHGDYWPANVLVTSDGSQVTGIVDWDLSQPMGLPSLDFVNLLISTRRIMEEKELGEILAEILRRGAWREHEQKLWEQKSQVLGGKLPEIKDALLIFWLQHLNAKLTKKGRHMVNPLWAYKNFAPVLNAL